MKKYLQRIPSIHSFNVTDSVSHVISIIERVLRPSFSIYFPFFVRFIMYNLAFSSWWCLDRVLCLKSGCFVLFVWMLRSPSCNSKKVNENAYPDITTPGLDNILLFLSAEKEITKELGGYSY
jgi:hypothetical protein